MPQDKLPLQDSKKHTSWLLRPLLWIYLIVKFLFKALVLVWACLAIYYQAGPWPWLRLVLALLFLAFGIWSLWVASKRYWVWVFAGVFALVLLWWATIRPTNDRLWSTDVAVLPHATIDGDKVHLFNVRNFDYRSRHDFTVRYEDRVVSLSHLTGVDFFVSYWMPGPVGHTFVSFIFDNAPPVNISIETRPEKGQGFDPIASLFKQFELIYVVGDERDLVRVRTNFRHEQVYMYHLYITPEKARRLFLVYLERINELYKHPEFYHLLSNSCTINIVRYANASGREGRVDFRHYLNGLIDGYLYHAGWLNNDLPFTELRQRSNIDQEAQAADKSPNFSEKIRANLPAAASD